MQQGLHQIFYPGTPGKSCISPLAFPHLRCSLGNVDSRKGQRPGESKETVGSVSEEILLFRLACKEKKGELKEMVEWSVYTKSGPASEE